MSGLLARPLTEVQPQLNDRKVQWVDGGGYPGGVPFIVRVIEKEGAMTVTYARFRAPDEPRP